MVPLVPQVSGLGQLNENYVLKANHFCDVKL